MSEDSMDKNRIIERFLQNAELSTEYAIKAQKVTVVFEKRKYSILKGDLPYYEALVSNLVEWHPLSKEKPKRSGSVCLVAREFRDKRYVDEAIWISKKADVYFEDEWDGPGFYKVDDGEMFKISGVCAWMPKPLPFDNPPDK